MNLQNYGSQNLFVVDDGLLPGPTQIQHLRQTKMRECTLSLWCCWIQDRSSEFPHDSVFSPQLLLFCVTFESKFDEAIQKFRIR